MSVTILMPAYNGAAFLARSLKSISEQTYRDWRVFVGDDGSTDDSHAVIARSGLPRLTLRHNARNIGWAQTVNLLLADVDTEYVAVLHQDDWWEPSFLATVTAMMDRSPASVLAVTAARVVHPSRPDAVWGLHQGWPTEQGSTCPSSVAVSLLLPADPIRCPAVLARTELYRKYSFDESLPYACDWLMWLRAAVMGSVEVSAEVLANYQLHEASQTTSLTRASLTTIDLLRMIEVLRTEWAGGREPVKDAIVRYTTEYHGHDEPREVRIDADLAWLIGYFLGDGSLGHYRARTTNKYGTTYEAEAVRGTGNGHGNGNGNGRYGAGA